MVCSKIKISLAIPKYNGETLPRSLITVEARTHVIRPQAVTRTAWGRNQKYVRFSSQQTILGRVPAKDYCTIWAMAGEIQLDALPYIDQGYEEPGVREAVRSPWCLRVTFDAS